MNKEEFRAAISGYIEGDLSSEQVQAFETLIQENESCRVLFETTLKAIELSKEKARPRLTDEFKNRLTEKLQAQFKDGCGKLAELDTP